MATRVLLLRVTTYPFETLASLRAARSLPLLQKLLGIQEELASEALDLCEALHARAGGRQEGDAERARARLVLVAVRRDLFNGRPVPKERMEAARPCMGEDLARRVELHASARTRQLQVQRAFKEAFSTDLAAARAGLMRVAREPLFQVGVRLSSRSLLASMREASSTDSSRWGHDERHAAVKAAAYLGRFTTKTSPNSVFCATALGHLSSDAGAGAAVDGNNSVEKVDILLSVAEARKVAACLAIHPCAMPAVTPRSNPTLRRIEGGWIFWRPFSPRNPTDDEVLSRAKDHPVLDLFLEEASSGRLTVAQLLEATGEQCEAEPQDLAGFFQQLVARGILIGEVEIPYTSRRPLQDLAVACRKAGCEAPWLDEVEAIEGCIGRLPDLDPSARIEMMDRVEGLLQALPHERPLRSDELFRLDAATALSVTLPAQVIQDLKAPLSWYAKLFASIYPERIYRTAYASRFLKKHPADTDVPLLDLYHGLFEPKPLERPVAFPEPSAVGRGGACLDEAARALVRARDFFASRARAAAAVGRAEVQLTDSDWHSLLGDPPEPDWSSGVLFQVAAGGAADLAAGRYHIILNALFSGAGLAMARLAHLHGGDHPPEENPIIQELREAWSWAEQLLGAEGEAIRAEITYMHTGRTANAGLRPLVFPYEIELPGEKASPGVEVIPLSDLVVRYESRLERFILRSLSRRARVIPVINSGINPEGFVSFLVAIGQQGLQPLGYFPGFDVEGVTRWPRFTCGRVVLFRARWSFGPGEAPAPVRDKGGSRGTGASSKPVASREDLQAAEFFAEVARWRRRHDLPRHLFVHTGADPKPFYVDLESPLFVDLLRRAITPAAPPAPEVTAAPAVPPALTVQPAPTVPPAPAAAARSGALYVTEMLPGPDQIWVADQRGRYASEYLLHLRSAGLDRIRKP